MSMDHFSKIQMRLDLLTKLSIAQNQKSSGDKGRTLEQVMKGIRKRIREKK
jgi:hypothetical protein